MELDEPIGSLVEQYIEIFKKNHKTEEKALKAVFTAFPDNQDKAKILAKVTLLNAFYHTRIKDLDLGKVTDHIFGMKEELDRHFREGEEIDYDLITKLSSPPGMTKISSFATKYCSWHMQEVYPIMDSYTKGMLYFINQKYLYKEHFSKNCLNDYKTYVKILNAFIEKYLLRQYTCKEIDMYLWAYAKYHREKDIITIERKQDF